MEIVQEATVREWIRRLPDLSVNPPTTHLTMLAVRSRKARELLGVKLKDLVIEKTVIRPVTNWRERYFNDIYNLAQLQFNGRYDFKDVMVKPEVTGIFSTLAPRDVKKAVADLIKENMELVFQGNDQSMYELAKQQSRFFGFLHQHQFKGNNFVDFDIDTDDVNVFNAVKSVLSSYTLFGIIRTSRGHHTIVDLRSAQAAADFYMQKTPERIKSQTFPAQVEFKRDPQPPMAGTYYASTIRPNNFVEIVQ
jgi:hypothetical protein